MATVPRPRMMALRFSITTDSTSPHVFDMVAYFLSQIPVLLEAGISGYPVIQRNVYNPAAPWGSGSGLSSGIVAMLDTDRPDDILEPFKALLSHINSAWPGFVFTANTTPYPTFHAWYQGNFDPTPAGYSQLAASRLLDREAITSNFTATKLAFEKFVEGGYAGVYMVAGTRVWTARPRGGGRTAVNPRWREAYLHGDECARILCRHPRATVMAELTSFPPVGT